MKLKRMNNFLSNFFKFKTVQQRLIFIVVIETTVSLLLLVLVSYQTIHSIEKNKLKTSMVSDLQQLTEKMTQNYMNMIQISQQMSPEGTVGSLLDSYFQAKTKYDVYRIGKEISDSLVNITFANSNIICRTYSNPLNGQKYFNGYFTYAGNSPESNKLLKKNGSIDYHPLHLSSTMGLGTWQVVSISRKINIEDGRELLIYIESRLEAKEVIDTLSKAQNMNYVLLQLDTNNRIQYSSAKDIAIGKSFQMEDEKEVGDSYFGKYRDYVGVRFTSDMGFVNVLLLPIRDYNREFYTWTRNVIGILVMAIFLFGFSFILLSRLIYTPLSIFSKEMKKLGKVI